MHPGVDHSITSFEIYARNLKKNLHLNSANVKICWGHVYCETPGALDV